MSGAVAYLRLENFYGSHKAFVESRSAAQLRGDASATSGCSPVTENKDVRTPLTSFASPPQSLSAEDRAVPCGLAPKYWAQDSVTLKKDGAGAQIGINRSGIALRVDRSSRFENTDDTSKQWIDMEDEAFMVWMQVELFPSFDKLYGEITEDLVKGQKYEVSITQKYPDLYRGFDIK
jgi:hypothetical protein